MASFFDRLPRPFFALAPLKDVTDPAYRALIREYAPPDIMWTEFVSADGLYHTREKKQMVDAENPLMRDLSFTPGERPILAQLFTGNPAMMEYAASLALSLGFDGVDINMGCPDRAVEKQGAGAAHIKNPTQACEVIRAAKRGVAGRGTVSVKTRIGYQSESLDTWIPVLLGEGLDALTIHLRTRKEMSKVPAHWELMSRVVALRDRAGVSTALIGNGDVMSLGEGKDKARETGADGIMLGRALFGNPWVFSGRDPETIAPPERFDALRRLAVLFGELHPPKHAALLKKHVKAFVTGFPSAAEVRARLMDADTVAEFLIRIDQERLCLS